MARFPRIQRWKLLVIVAFLYAIVLGVTGSVLAHGTRGLRGLTGHALGMGAAWLTVYASERTLRRATVPFLLAIVLLLLAVRYTSLGHTVNGARRWMGVGKVSFQPSEFAKPAVVLGIAMTAGTGASIEMHATVALCVLASLLLIAAQPDWGTVSILTSVLLLAAAMRGRRWLAAALIGAAVFSLGALSSPHVQQRVQSFIHAEDEPRDRGYQIRQSLEALERAGLLGVDHDRRYALERTPSATRDFAFSTYAECFGLVPMVGLLLFLSVALIAGMGDMAQTRSQYGLFLGSLSLSAIYVQIIVNMMSVLGLIPIVGVPFPFLSEGGSSALASWLLVGLFAHRHEDKLL